LDTSEHAEHDRLAFRKTKVGWKLLAEVTASDGSVLRADEVLSLKRDSRIAAVAKLDELLTVLLETSQDRRARLRTAADQLEAFRARVTKEGEP